MDELQVIPEQLTSKDDFIISELQFVVITLCWTIRQAIDSKLAKTVKNHTLIEEDLEDWEKLGEYCYDAHSFICHARELLDKHQRN